MILWNVAYNCVCVTAEQLWETAACLLLLTSSRWPGSRPAAHTHTHTHGQPHFDVSAHQHSAVITGWDMNVCTHTSVSTHTLTRAAKGNLAPSRRVSFTFYLNLTAGPTR